MDFILFFLFNKYKNNYIINFSFNIIKKLKCKYLNNYNNIILIKLK